MFTDLILSKAYMRNKPLSILLPKRRQRCLKSFMQQGYTPFL